MRLAETSLLIAAFLQQVYSHAFLVSPTPREGAEMSTQSKAPGFKIAEFPVPEKRLTRAEGCPSADAAGTATKLADRTIPVEWNLPIPHANPPGVRVAIMFEGEDTFEVLQDGVDVKTLKLTVDAPAGKSGAAVLQWLWASQEDGGYYLACADIEVPADGGAGGAAAPAPAPIAATPATPDANANVPTAPAGGNDLVAPLDGAVPAAPAGPDNAVAPPPPPEQPAAVPSGTAPDAASGTGDDCETVTVTAAPATDDCETVTVTANGAAPPTPAAIATGANDAGAAIAAPAPVANAGDAGVDVGAGDAPTQTVTVGLVTVTVQPDGTVTTPAAGAAPASDPATLDASTNAGDLQTGGASAPALSGDAAPAPAANTDTPAGNADAGAATGATPSSDAAASGTEPCETVTVTAAAVDTAASPTDNSASGTEPCETVTVTAAPDANNAAAPAPVAPEAVEPCETVTVTVTGQPPAPTL